MTLLSEITWNVVDPFKSNGAISSYLYLARKEGRNEHIDL